MKSLAILFALVALALPLASGAAWAHSTKSSATAYKHWPAYFEKKYMQGCSAGKAGRAAYCKCTLAYLEKHYSLNVFIALPKAKEQKMVLGAAKACISKYHG